MKMLVIGVLIIVLGVAAWFFLWPESPAPTNLLDAENSVSAPTNFNEVGILHFPAPESGQAEGTFEYNDGSGTTTLKISMDGLSVCAAPNGPPRVDEPSRVEAGAAPCMAMSITFNIPFDGKTALMEGIREGDTILVRKMRVAAENEELRSFEPGNIFISWPAAIALIEGCQVDMATQTHALDVYLDLKNGLKVRAVEPMIDDMFAVIQRSQPRCGTFPVATE